MIKHENGVSNVLDVVKARLRKIANRIDLEELKESVKSFKEWELYVKKLKSWCEGTILFS